MKLNKLRDIFTYKRVKQHIMDSADSITDDDIRNAKSDFGIQEMIQAKAEADKKLRKKGIEKPRTKQYK